MPNTPEGNRVTGNKQNILFGMVRSSEDVMWLPVWQADLKKRKKKVIQAILSSSGMHLSVYNCVYQVTPIVFSWRAPQQLVIIIQVFIKC